MLAKVRGSDERPHEESVTHIGGDFFWGGGGCTMMKKK